MVETKEKQYEVNYENCLKHNFRNNVQDAVKFYLGLTNRDVVDGFILYPHALNPFLRIMETLRETRNMVILPSFNNDDADSVNQPAYLIMKVDGESKYITKFTIGFM